MAFLLHAGSSAVGQRVVRQATVSSSSSEALQLTADVLSSQATYSVVNALRPIGPQGRCTLTLDFTPQVTVPF